MAEEFCYNEAGQLTVCCTSVEYMYMKKYEERIYTLTINIYKTQTAPEWFKDMYVKQG